MCRKLFYLMVFTVLLGMVSTTMAQDDPSLMGWWTFDGHTNDVSGNERHGTINGDPSFGAGAFGLALEFDGDDYVTIEGYKGVLGTNPFSIACWIKTTNTAQQQIIYYGTDIGGQRIEFRMQNNQLRLSNGNGNARSVTAVNDGEWHHVVMTLPADSLIDDAVFYFDGEPDTQTRSDADSMFDVVADWDVTIGYRPSRNDRPFIGSIDEVAMYDKVLTQEEVLQIMGTGGEPYPYALLPTPVDGALVEDTWVSLSWSPGTLAISHDLYFGENFDDVNDGTNNTFVDNYAETSVILGIINYPYPDGLVPGTTYYWRIDEVNDADPNSPWKGDVWSFTIPPKTAYNLDPVNGAKYIDPNVTLGWTGGFAVKLHHIYFGDNFDDVNDGATATYKGVLSDPTYTPGTLEMDKVYYWRVDEYDGDATHKGDVISFTTMPVIDITDPNLIGWWKFDAGVGVIAPDFSGHGNHSLIVNPNWLSPGWIGDSALSFGANSYVAIRNLVLNDANEPEVSVSAWIRTSESGMQTIASFDRSDYWRLEAGDSQYAGPGLVGWEVSTSTEIIDLVSQRRVDDGQWHHVAGVFDNGTMTIYIDGTPDASATGGNAFGIGSTRYGFIGSQSEATSFDGNRSGSPGHWLGSIDDVRIYDIALTQDDIAQVMRGDPLLAWGHQPPSGVYDIETVPSLLTWNPGDMAAQHDVYFDTDEQAIQNADASDTTGVYRGRQSGSEYVLAEPLAWDQSYYWRIDEFNTDGTITKGGVRAIIVADFRLIDDFESYDAEDNQIWFFWHDGIGYGTPDFPPYFAGNDTGAAVGDEDTASYTEETIVNGGKQSMPFWYNNNEQDKSKYSETQMTLIAPRDWSKHEVAELSLWFRGYPPIVGSFTEAPVGTYTMTASGTDITGTADEFHYAYTTLTGPGTIIARVQSVSYTHAWAKAGVMIRETLDPNSAHALVCATPGNGVAFQGRTTTDGSSFNTNETEITAPHWIKLERDVMGNFTASHSADGSTWIPVGNSVPTLVTMSSSVYVGLALTSHNTALTCEAVFSNVTITGVVSQQWVNQDIGILGNDVEPLYVALSNVAGTPAVVYHEDANAATIDTWTEWVIPLQAFTDQDLNLADVDRIAIGLGTQGNMTIPGGSGKMFFDDIRLYRSRPEPEPEPEL